jgi:hypothetical protein
VSEWLQRLQRRRLAVGEGKQRGAVYRWHEQEQLTQSIKACYTWELVRVGVFSGSLLTAVLAGARGCGCSGECIPWQRLYNIQDMIVIYFCSCICKLKWGRSFLCIIIGLQSHGSSVWLHGEARSFVEEGVNLAEGVSLAYLVLLGRES